MKTYTLTLAIGLLSATGLHAAELRADSLLDFLYRGMPYPDSVMYDEGFWRKNIETSLLAREEMSWGARVPEREFRHFVLPVRVNNEDLDMSRPAFYSELKERVKNLTMEEAILEVNHWCHEKVTYQPSDARTSSPLSAVSQAIGRCGEESTFTVAALRSIGIPARQVYTPRWAHTDDNHAWVEAWADGKWYFLGACEPEPILNLGWFNAPASRGMLMTTNVFGDYDGPEEVLDKTKYYTTINVTSNYAPVAEVKAIVRHTDGRPASNVKVNFCLYNYAEYFPVATKWTDGDGKVEIVAGSGDMLLWATDGAKFGFAKGNHNSNVNIVLDKDSLYSGKVDFDIIPPSSGATIPRPTEEQAAENARRIAAEDATRNAYTATFATPQKAEELSKTLGLGKEKLTKILLESRGNHVMITDFLTSLPADMRKKALDLLTTVSEKDRRDISFAVLKDHLMTPDYPSALYTDYILNPRVENEGLTPYKAYFLNKFRPEERQHFASDPTLWIAEVKKHIAIRQDNNPKRLRISPEAVWENGMADPLSASICLVAGARSFGIPARIDPITGKTQYADKTGAWIDIDLTSEVRTAKPERCVLTASEIQTSVVKDPKYYSHYSLSKIENGVPRQLEYEEFMPLNDFLAAKPELDKGQYVLTTGQRLADGSVLAHSEFFTVTDTKAVAVPFSFRHDDSMIQVLGSLNSEALYHDITTETDKSLLSTTGRRYYVLGLIRPNHEPTSHALNDISALAGDFEKTGNKIMLLFADNSEAERYDATRFPKLPNNVVYGIDKDGKIAKELTQSLNLREEESPVFIIADTFNRVVYCQSGYTIGTGEALLNVLDRLKE